MENLRDRLLSVLNDTLIERVEPMIVEAELPTELVAPVTAYLQSKIDALREYVDALGDPEDEEELYRSTAFWWLELKNEWARFNQVTQYRMIRLGEMSPTLQAKGAVCQEVLGRVERVLLPRDVAMLTEIWAEPLVFGQRDLRQVRSFLDHHRAAVGRIDHLMVAASDTYAHLVKVVDETTDPATRERVSSLMSLYERELGVLRDDMQQVLAVDFAMAWRDIEAQIYAASEALGGHTQVMPPNTAMHVDARSLPGLGDVVLGAARLLLGTAEAPEARMAANKTAHHTIQCDVSERDGSHVIELRDTGAGDLDRRVADDDAQRDAWAALQRRVASLGGGVTMACAPGESTTITAVLPVPRTGAVEAFVVLEGRRAALVRSAWVRGIRASAADEHALDLRGDTAGLGVSVDLALPSGRELSVRVDRVGASLRSLVLPATAAEDPSVLAFDGVVYHRAAFVPVYGERLLLAQRAANEIDRQMVA